MAGTYVRDVRAENLAEIEAEKEKILNMPARCWREAVHRDKAELEASDLSQRDGLVPEKQAKWRRQFFHLINKAGSTLKV